MGKGYKFIAVAFLAVALVAVIVTFALSGVDFISYLTSSQAIAIYVFIIVAGSAIALLMARDFFKRM